MSAFKVGDEVALLMGGRFVCMGLLLKEVGEHWSVDVFLSGTPHIVTSEGLEMFPCSEWSRSLAARFVRYESELERKVSRLQAELDEALSQIKELQLKTCNVETEFGAAEQAVRDCEELLVTRSEESRLALSLRHVVSGFCFFVRRVRCPKGVPMWVIRSGLDTSKDGAARFIDWKKSGKEVWIESGELVVSLLNLIEARQGEVPAAPKLRGAKGKGATDPTDPPNYFDLARRAAVPTVRNRPTVLRGL